MMLFLLICGGFNSSRFSYSNTLIVLSPYSKVSGSYLPFSLSWTQNKYENPETGNTTQQLLSTGPYCSGEFIESFLI